MHLRAPSSLPPARGAGRGPHSPPNPPGAGSGRGGGVSGEVKGLTFWAPGQQGQTPNTHLREESAEPKPGLPALPTAWTGARGGSAREGEPEGGSPHSPLPGPTAAGAGVRGARRSSCSERHNLPGPGGRRRETSAAPRVARITPGPRPSRRVPGRSLRSQRGVGRLRRERGALRLRGGSHLRGPGPLPRPRRGAHQPWGAARAAWPPSHGLC